MNIDEQIVVPIEQQIAQKYLSNDNDLIALRARKKEIDFTIRQIEGEQESLKNAMIREYLENGLFPASDILHIKKVPIGVIVTDESKIPDQFFKIEKKLDKKALNEAVKGGEEIDGATLDNGGYTIMIRG